MKNVHLTQMMYWHYPVKMKHNISYFYNALLEYYPNIVQTSFSQLSQQLENSQISHREPQPFDSHKFLILEINT